MMRVWLVVAGSLWTLVVLAISVLTAVAPQRSGALALAEVGASFVLLSLLPWVPVALLELPPQLRLAHQLRTGLRITLGLAVALAVVRFGPVWVSLPPADAGGMRIGVTSWNLETGEADSEAVVQTLRNAPPGVIGLVELARANADPIKADAAIQARFPYQLIYPRDGSLGMGLLSSYPILESGRIADEPPVIWARLDLGKGRTLTVVEAHPMPAEVLPMTPFHLPLNYDASARDAQIRTLRQTVDGFLAGGQPLILAGDFNVTDREPAYGDLSRGLLDAHLEVGLGPGSTWRADPLKWLPLGIVRIDMVFGGNAVRPMTVMVDCTPRGSDHCLIQASLALPAASATASSPDAPKMCGACSISTASSSASFPTATRLRPTTGLIRSIRSPRTRARTGLSSSSTGS